MLHPLKGFTQKNNQYIVFYLTIRLTKSMIPWIENEGTTCINWLEFNLLLQVTFKVFLKIPENMFMSKFCILK